MRCRILESKRSAKRRERNCRQANWEVQFLMQSALEVFYKDAKKPNALIRQFIWMFSNMIYTGKHGETQYTGSPWFTTACLVSIWSSNRSSCRYLQPSSDAERPTCDYNHVTTCWTFGNICSCLQRPEITWPRFLTVLLKIGIYLKFSAPSKPLHLVNILA